MRNVAEMMILKARIIDREGNHASAIDELDRAKMVASDDGRSRATILRARARSVALYEGLAASARDFEEALLNLPNDAHGLIWLEVVTGDVTRLAPIAKRGNWPAPVARFLLGEISRDVLYLECDRGTIEDVRRRRRCEALCYAAIYEESRGDMKHARADYEACVACGTRAPPHAAYAIDRLLLFK
jgi:hypothetical protein